MNEIYKLNLDLKIRHESYGNILGYGTYHKGTLFKIVGEPRPEKKKYKLECLDDKYEHNPMYIRKSVLKQFFELVSTDELQELIKELII